MISSIYKDRHDVFNSPTHLASTVLHVAALCLSRQHWITVVSTTNSATQGCHVVRTLAAEECQEDF